MRVKNTSPRSDKYNQPVMLMFDGAEKLTMSFVEIWDLETTNHNSDTHAAIVTHSNRLLTLLSHSGKFLLQRNTHARLETHMKLFRQGDVLLLECNRQPSADAKLITDNGKTILAYGEVTGHSHQVVAAVDPGLLIGSDDVPAMQLFEEPNGSRILVLKRDCDLKHEEHGTIALGGGSTFEVRRQAEWSLDYVRNVAD